MSFRLDSCVQSVETNLQCDTAAGGVVRTGAAGRERPANGAVLQRVPRRVPVCAHRHRQRGVLRMLPRGRR